jgi:polar amino acid transport system permease protein
MNLTYLREVAPDLAHGLLVTLEATAVGMTLASVFGLIVAAVRLLKVPILGRVFGLYVLFFRNTPFLIQLYFLFYVLPGWGVLISATTAGVLGLALQYSAYTAEMYRAGFESVPTSQWEAAHALNLGRVQTLRLVILAQAVRPILPALGNQLISMFKDSSLLAAITILELFGTARELASVSFQFTTIFTAVGLIYLAISYPASLLVGRLQSRFGEL